MNIKNIFSYFKYKFRKKIINENSKFLNFQFLTPSKNAEKVEIYLDSLNEALNHDDVKNIAISGSYGAGKSSFIKTFETQNLQYNFLDISLATFNKENKDLSLIEKSILQQIFYKVEQDDVPFSRFKRINKLSWLKSKTILALSFILSLLIILNSKFLNPFFLNNFSINIIAIVILIGASFVFLKSIIKNFTGITLDKLNLQNLEITTNKPDENSLLNKYLDEIIYFFSETKYNIVIFQDLDRFDNIEIFTKLRELNNFLNNSEQVNKKIVFIYAVKDEMFTEEDSRTKFFDFMIPIIPYVNSSTSYEKLLEFFENDLKDKIQFSTKAKQEDFKEFLRDISLYIKDMRLLKNIYNEYKIYDKKIGKDLDKIKLLAIMVYKNFYPEDFSLLHKDKGLVFDIFKNKSKFIKDIDNEYNQNIIDKKIIIKNIEDEPINNIDDLRKIYIYKIIESISQDPPYLRVDSNHIQFKDALNDENFKLIQNSNQIRHPSYSDNTTFTDIENLLGNFKGREKLIQNKNKNSIEILNKEIQEIRKKQKELNYRSIFKLCSLEKIKNKIIEKLDKKDLLQSLLINGHIDENYFMFLSYSFDKSLTPSDTEFLKSVINNTELSYDYKLTNLKELVAKLKPNEYQKTATLNYNLVNFLIENKNKNKFEPQCEAIFQQLSNNSQKSKKFIFNYIDLLPQQNIFITEITEKWKNIWSYIYSNDNFNSEQKEDYFYIFLYNLSAHQIISLNHNNSLKQFLENLIKIKDLVAEDNDKMKIIIEELDINFNNLSEPITNTPLFEYIYKNKYFILNKLMIEQIVYTRLSPQDEIEKDLYSQHLTTVRNLDKGKKLIEVIEDNIDVYIDKIFLHLEDNIQEHQDTIIWLLNNENLNEEQKEAIIKHEETILDDITQIELTELYKLLIECNKVKATWDNLLHYYTSNENSVSTELIQYLNIEENYKSLSKSKINNEEDFDKNTILSNFNKEIMLCNEISDEAYKYLIKSIWYITYPKLDIENLNYDKVLYMLEANKFKFNSINFNDLKGNFDLQIELIEKNNSDLIEKFEEFEFDTNDIIGILESKVINSKIKKELVEIMDYDLITNNQIASLCFKFKDKNIQPPIYYINNIVKSLDSLENKINMIISENNQLSEEEFIELLNMLPSNYSKITLLDGKQTTLISTNYNKELIKILHNRKFITKDKVEKKKKIRLFIKNRR
ncbi:MAG: hypothetical protein DRG78_01950 [Epsilonproteobacteria bacterium]|nr:MAG: hypothetical protein DRG78_01950 [Campylobacterota bacterium]